MRIYPACAESGALAPNPALVKFPLEALHVLPPAIHHTLVCLSLNHFIHSLPAGSDKSVAVINRSKVYQHRGAAIRALSQYVGKNKTQSSDLSIASILVFMSMEVRKLSRPRKAKPLTWHTVTKPCHGRLALARHWLEAPRRHPWRLQGAHEAVSASRAHYRRIHPVRLLPSIQSSNHPLTPPAS